ncbi:MAG: NAD(P)H-hydrate dehydratase [Synechococcaceae cyanobacterium SM2_3_2]|nr:NAD(P)H-hydrate dehydratase [Synechococcaceae cyanobacterium SM2_3_2]
MNGIPHPHLLTVAQMQTLEQRLFEWGMPVAALMEKVSLGAFAQITACYPQARFPRIGILLGSGHNGGDGLVVGRELRLEGRTIKVWQGSSPLKPLTASHAAYLQALGGSWVQQVENLADCDLLIDALFGIGLSRPLGDPWAGAVAWANQSELPIVSLDIPSGLSADTGSPLGPCIRADLTLCLGLWKRGLWQDSALEWIGELVGIDFGTPAALLQDWDRDLTLPRLITPPLAHSWLPSHPPLQTHKYRQGHLLLICGSAQYAGAAVLTVLGSRGSGAGMVTVAVPQALKPLIHYWAPEVLVWPCEQTATGGIAHLGSLDLCRYSAIALGPGLGDSAAHLVKVMRHQLVEQTDSGYRIPWLLDADGLNGLAEWGVENLGDLAAQTIVTPHEGEFRRLFGQIDLHDRLSAAHTAITQVGLTLLLKGSRTIIASPQGSWVNPQSTPALARGGSGDVLTGLLAGLLAQGRNISEAAAVAAWWHSQAALSLQAAQGHTGVDPVALAATLPSVLARVQKGIKTDGIPSAES